MQVDAIDLLVACHWLAAFSCCRVWRCFIVSSTLKAMPARVNFPTVLSESSVVIRSGLMPFNSSDALSTLISPISGDTGTVLFRWFLCCYAVVAVVTLRAQDVMRSGYYGNIAERAVSAYSGIPVFIVRSICFLDSCCNPVAVVSRRCLWRRWRYLTGRHSYVVCASYIYSECPHAL